MDELKIQRFGLAHENFELSIFDMNGRLLLKQELFDFQQTLNVSHLPVGTYSLQIGNADHIVYREKIMKR
jgi:hypothetical protein